MNGYFKNCSAKILATVLIMPLICITQLKKTWLLMPDVESLLPQDNLQVQTSRSFKYEAGKPVGPCLDWPCYITSVTKDSIHSHSVFVVMLGLPASEILRSHRGRYSNMTFADLRSGENVTVSNEGRVYNDLLLQLYDKDQQQLQEQDEKDPTLDQRHFAKCSVLVHIGSQIAGWESRTLECAFDDKQLSTSEWESMTSSVLWRHTKEKEKPFVRISNVMELNPTAGLLETVQVKPGKGVLGCVAGVDYWSPYWKDVMSAYLAVGYSPIVWGVPFLLSSEYGQAVQSCLAPWIENGSVVLVESVYTNSMFASGPRTADQGDGPYNYLFSGHKPAFFNACLVHGRALNLTWVAIHDFDEIFVPTNADTLLEALDLLSNESKCYVNLRSISAVPEPNTVTNATSLMDHFAGLRIEDDLVKQYGKTIHNVSQALRCGVHGTAHCRDNSKRVPQATNENGLRLASPDSGIFVMHLTNMARTRTQASTPGQDMTPIPFVERSELAREFQNILNVPSSCEIVKDRSRMGQKSSVV